jgi:hypothetical protein
MQRPLTRIAVAFIALFCAGCATTPRTATPEAISGYKRIGVISVAAYSFSRLHVGFTVFGNEQEKIDSSTWSVDSSYEQQLATVLSNLGGFEVVIGEYSRSDFLRIYELNGPWDAPAFRGPNWGAIEKPIKDHCAKNQLGGILANFAVDAQDFIGGTNQYVRGAGLYTRGFGDSTRHSFLHLISGVALVDCQTAKPVAVRGLATTQEGWPGQILRASPMKPFPTEISRMPLERLSEQQLASIKSSLVELPTKAWEPTIRAIFGR